MLASVNSSFNATKIISIVLLCNSLILRGKMYREEGIETRICLLKTRNIERLIPKSRKITLFNAHMALFCSVDAKNEQPTSISIKYVVQNILLCM